MAKLRAYYDIDMTSDDVWYGEVTVANATTIVVTDGVFSATHRGRFSYDEFGYVRGTLSGFTGSYAGTTYVTISEINRSVDVYNSYMLVGDFDGAYRYEFSGADVFTGSRYGDHLLGYGGNDVLKGNGGHDQLEGGDGIDRLLGGDGWDGLNGGTGNDALRGGLGRDILRGGAGRDNFVFATVTEAGNGAGTDLVRDFEHGLDHVILAAIDANTKQAGNQAFRFIGDHAFTGRASELVYRNGIVAGDVNGDGVGDFHIDITNDARLTVTDFVL